MDNKEETSYDPTYVAQMSVTQMICGPNGLSPKHLMTHSANKKSHDTTSLPG